MGIVIVIARGLISPMKARDAILGLIRDSKIQAIRVAELSGITANTISRWRADQDAHIRPSSVEAIASALHCQTIWKDYNKTECEFADEESPSLEKGGATMEIEQRYEAHVVEGQRERFDKVTGTWERYDEEGDEWHVLGGGVSRKQMPTK